MGSCATIKEMLSNYIEKELSAQDEKTVKDHLALCQSCRSVFQEAEYIKIRLSGMEIFEVSDRFIQNFQARIETPYSDDNPVFTVKNISWSLSGLAALVGAYFVFLLFVPSDNIQLAEPLKNSSPRNEDAAVSNKDNPVTNIEKAGVKEAEFKLPVKGDTTTNTEKKSNTENLNLIEDKQ